MTENVPLVLVDGSSYLYRAFHALPPLTAPGGEPSGALYGVLGMLRKLRADYGPQRMAVVFDAPGKTFRDDLYAEYKANRPSMPEELAVQIEPLHELVRAMGLPLLCIPGVEADDVIATLAAQAQARGEPVVISTGDKDLAQLVSDRVTLVNTMNGTVLDPPRVREKFGVDPERIVDLLTLVGDTVDNVPGVDKVGPKTAAKWLAEYGSLDAVIENADRIKGKVGENLRAALERLPLSRELVTVRRDVDLGIDEHELALGKPDTTRLREMYGRFGFRRWLEELEGNAGADSADDPPPEEAQRRDYSAIQDDRAFRDLLNRLEHAELVAFDTETTSLDYMQARIVGVSFSVEPGRGWYVPLAHEGPDAAPQLERARTLERLRPWLESAERAKLGHHLKYDRNVLANHGITLRGIREDTMLESYVLDAGANRHDLDSLAERHLGHRMITYEDVAGKGAKQIPFAEVAVARATEYAAEDADICLRLHQALNPRLADAEGPRAVYREIELPLVPVLSDMERTGVRVDAELLRAQSAELAKRMDEVSERAYSEAGAEFNLGSPKQIQEILFDRLGLPVLRRTPKGQPSTAEDVLEQMAAEYPLPRLILEHRGLAKLRSTYTERLPERIHPETGRVHTSYHQAVAATGRLSSSDPNLQNIPVRTDEGRRIRQAFIAEPGQVLLAADYSQIELRIMAHLSRDRGLLEAFAAGEDIHRATAAEVFGLEPASVGPDQRRAAKAINFGLIYGMSAFGLARNLGIEQSQAREYIDRYFARYPGVKDYMERAKEQARDQGYVETLFGRRLYLPEIGSRNPARRAQSERVAINAPMQGTAADIIKRAMLKVAARLEEGVLHARMIMQVHDELVLEVREDAVEALRTAVVADMSGAAELAVDLVVDVGVGANWDAAH
ncbi:DNA polymerase I [Thioalkalivibrio nitratireducens DSM 14787]|uniref:DNA polymerase I n=1 Tax=Thioalkalivibrio nitratireducens (strain DSM 14787 / UNIQEM 213 / ALEN2) TaxID=1255043 RepID=L0E265_THIND|nr:DNA polymerase I [Thioalkalivibrio nitratireducens]AGA35368.1 DNA polymerase I [Thioalkalivibrio nitratireducens DSM 14787]